MSETPHARLALITVWDGLRPDFVSPEVTPVLHACAAAGVWHDASYCAYPSETRVNAAALTTGGYPGRTGIPGNSIYVPGFDPADPLALLNTGDHTHLARLAALDGPVVRTPGLADRIAAAGGVTVVASSGSPGSALTLNPRPDAITVNQALRQPAPLIADLLARIGPPADHARPQTAWSDWTLQALTDYLLPEVVMPALAADRPALGMWWQIDPDNAAHRHGLGTPETVQSLRDNDHRLALLLEAIDRLGLAPVTDIIVTADHGFSSAGPRRNFQGRFDAAPWMAGLHHGDIVTTGEGGGAISLHPRAAHHAGAIVEWLQREPWIGSIFARDDGPAAGLPGTLPLSLVWNGRTGPRAPDIKFSTGWTHEANEA